MSKVKMPEPVACLWIRDGSVVNAFAHTPNLKEGDQLSEYFAEKGFAEEPLITTTQAEAYADARVKECLEEAAKICWEMQSAPEFGKDDKDHWLAIAERRIRALISPTKNEAEE